MAKIKQPKKCRNFMYTQQVSYLPKNMTPDDFYRHVETVLAPKRLASIVHDKDMKDDNVTPADEHVHMMLQFENARSVNQLAKDVGDSAQYFEVWNGKVENGFSYLVHATDNSRHKHQYSCDEVKANFDYPAMISRVSKKVSKVTTITTEHRINAILDLIATGDMTFEDAKRQLSGSAYAKASDKMKKVHELYLERKAEELYRQMREDNEAVAVHWFYGGTETGKTYLAETLAKESSAYYKTTTQKDPFQFYQAEPTIILDELRPEVIPYSELLAMFNPFSGGKVTVSSRFYNKALACRTVYITTPYDPVTFYRSYGLNRYDKGNQLFRRLSSVLLFDMEWIYKMDYNEKYDKYEIVDKKENRYSKRKQNPYVLNNVFDMIR